MNGEIKSAGVTFLRRLVDMALVSKEDMDKIMKNMEAEIV